MLKTNRHYSICVAAIRLQQPLSFFVLFSYSFVFEMPGLNRKGKETCEYCKTQTTKGKIVRHKKSATGTITCAKCLNFSTHSQVVINFLITKNQSFSQPKNFHKCQFFHQLFARFLCWRLHRQKVHNTQSVAETKNVDVTQFVEEIYVGV